MSLHVAVENTTEHCTSGWTVVYTLARVDCHVRVSVDFSQKSPERGVVESGSKSGAFGGVVWLVAFHWFAEVSIGIAVALIITVVWP